jgi:hypothetical protein
MALYRVRPTWDAAAGDVTVVEYFHEGFGHYFVTPYPGEQQTLDAGNDWRRTGLAFRAWSSSGPDRVAMCRFYSQSMFAPKSTHFYTHVESECRSLAGQAGWWPEGPTFAVRLVEGAGAARGCATGTVPLYRLYNNGQGGAPNHRYTIDAATVDQMIARGWTPEGEGSGGMFACVAER